MCLTLFGLLSFFLHSYTTSVKIAIVLENPKEAYTVTTFHKIIKNCTEGKRLSIMTFECVSL